MLECGRFGNFEGVSDAPTQDMVLTATRVCIVPSLVSSRLALSYHPFLPLTLASTITVSTDPPE